jgi:transcriptional regulator with XRE-family HTH domain
MTGPPSQPPDRGADPEPIGVILARLRRLRNLSGHDLGQATGMSQSKVSRIERGLTLPSPEEVDRLVTALGGPTALAVDLRQRVQRLRAEMIDLRAGGRRLHLGIFQQEVADLEKSATTIRIFQPGLLPGLIQTDEYARAMLNAFVRPLPAGTPGAARHDVLGAVDQRMHRQQALNDPAKKVVLVFTEAALGYRVCPADVMLTQLRKIRDRAQLPNVTIAILQQEAELRYPPLLGFQILDDKAVVVDLPTTSSYARSDEDIRVFQTIFDWYLEDATTDIDEILDRYFRRYARMVGDDAE